MNTMQHPDQAYAGAAPRDGVAPTTYYNRPLLKPPDWDTSVIAYLFLGGVTGGLGIISMLANPEREPEQRLRRTARFASLVLAAANPAVLITHLGRPERFLHMLRIVKLKSPMSVGTWGLVAYSGVAGANVMRELAEMDVLPRWVRYLVPGFLTQLHALAGSYLAGYTGVLLSATANPMWSAGKRHIPAACVCSGLSSACALMSLLSTFEGNHEAVPKVERLEMVSSLAELLLLKDFQRTGGDYAKPMFEGRPGERLRTYTIVAGIAVPMALNVLGQIVKLPKPVDAVRTTAASLLTLLGGYIFRETLVEGGKDAVRDPRTAFKQPK